MPDFQSLINSLTSGDSVSPVSSERGLNEIFQDAINSYKGTTTIYDDPSRYDKGMPPGYDVDNWRYQRQSKANRWATAIPRLLGQAVAKTVQDVGLLSGLMGIDNNADERGGWIAGAADNFLVDWGESLEDSVKEMFPIYKSPDWADRTVFQKMGKASWWTDEVVDGLAFMLSTLIPGAAMSKAGSALKLGKLFGSELTFDAAQKMGKGVLGADKAKKAGQLATIWAFQTAGESMFEAKDARDSTIENLTGKINPETGQLYSSDEIKMISASNAADVFKMNMMALAVSNALEVKWLFGGLPSQLNKGLMVNVAAGLEKKVAKTALGRAMGTYKAGIAKGLVKGAITEGLWEENIQYSIQKINDGTRGLNGDNILEKMVEGMGMLPDLSDDARMESVMLGAIIGSPAGVYSEVKQKRSADRSASNALKEIEDQDQKFLNPDFIKRKDDYNITLKKEEDGSITVTDDNGTHPSTPEELQKLKTMYGLDIDSKSTVKVKGKVMVDDNGQVVVDPDKRRNYLSQVKFTQDLQDVLDQEGDATEKGKAMEAIVSNDFFTQWAKSHIRWGATKQLLQRLDMFKDMSVDDMSILGLDPSTDINKKVDQWKQRVNELQDLYNTIELGTYGDRKLKDELFSIASRVDAIDQQIKHLAMKETVGYDNDIQYDEINNLVYEYRALSQQLSAIDTADVDNSVNNYEKERQDTLKRLKETEQKILDAKKLYNELSDKKLSLDTNAVGEFLSAATMQKEISQKLTAHLNVARKSLLDKWNRYADKKKGQKYFNEDSGKGVVEDVDKISIDDKTTKQAFDNYLKRKVNRKRLGYNIDEVRAEYASKQISERLDKGEPVLDVVAYANGIKPIYQRDKDRLLQSLSVALNSLIEEGEPVVRENGDTIMMNQENADTYSDVTMEEDLDLVNPAKIVQQKITMLEDAIKSIQGKDTTQSSILRGTEEQISEKIRRKVIEDDFLQDTNEIIQNFEASNNYDQQIAPQVQKLHDLLRLVDDVNIVSDSVITNKEFAKEQEVETTPTTLHQEIKRHIDILNKVDRLQESLREDRSKENERINKRFIGSLLYSLGLVQNEDKLSKGELEDVYDIISKVPGIDQVKQFDIAAYDNIINYLHNNENVRNSLIGVLDQHMKNLKPESVLRLWVNMLSDDQFKPKGGKIKTQGDPKRPEKYIKNPLSVFNAIMLQWAYYDEPGMGGKDSPIVKYLNDNNLEAFEENLSKDKEIAEERKQQLMAMLSMHQKFLPLWELKMAAQSQIDLKDTITRFHKRLKAEMKARKLFAPTIQQEIALRKAVFLLSQKDVTDPLYGMIYMKGWAGTGKTSVFIPWLTEIMGYEQKDVIAISSNEDTTRILNKEVGLDGTLTHKGITEESVKDKKLIIIDEINKITPEDIQPIMDVMRSAVNKGARIILIGDPLQDRGDFDADIDNFSLLDQLYVEVRRIEPMTVLYRSYIGALNNFVNSFRNEWGDIANRPTIARCSHVDPTSTNESLYGASGVLSEDDFVKNTVTILRNQQNNGKSKIIIANEGILDKIRKLLDENKIKHDTENPMLILRTPGNSEGLTYDMAFTFIKRNVGQGNQDYNARIYTAITRAREFTYLGAFNIKTLKDENGKRNDADLKKTIADDIDNRYEQLNKQLEAEVKTLSGEVVVDEQVEENKDNETEDEYFENQSDYPVEPIVVHERKYDRDSQVHNLNHPTSYIYTAKNNDIYVKPKPGTKVYYATIQNPTADGKYIPAVGVFMKGARENFYMQVGILNEEEIKSIGLTPGDNYAKAEVVKGNKNIYYFNPDVMSFDDAIIAEGTYMSGNPLLFDYKGEKRPVKSKRELIERFAKMLGIEVKDMDYVVNNSKIVTWNSKTISDTKDSITNATDALVKGFAYLQISGLQQKSSKKEQVDNYYIYLTPRKLNSKDMESWKPLSDFIEKVESLQKMSGLSYDTDKDLFVSLVNRTGKNTLTYKYGKDGLSIIDRVKEKVSEENFTALFNEDGTLTDDANKLINDIYTLAHRSEDKNDTGHQDGQAQKVINRLAQSNTMTDDIILRTESRMGNITIMKGLGLLSGTDRGENLKYDENGVPDIGRSKAKIRYFRRIAKFLHGEELITPESINEFRRRLQPWSLATLKSLFSVDENGDSNIKNGFGLRLDIMGDELKQMNDGNFQSVEESLNGIIPTQVSIKIDKIIDKAQPSDHTAEPSNDSADISYDSFMLKTDEPIGEIISMKKAYRMLKKIMPFLKEKHVVFLSRLDMMRVAGGRKVWGMVEHDTRILYLEKDENGNVPTRAMRHEAFHRVFQYFLHEGERSQLMSYARDRWGDLGNKQLMEKLADAYMDWQSDKVTIRGRALEIFRSILRWFGFINDNKTTLPEFFNRMDRGYYWFQVDDIIDMDAYMTKLQDFNVPEGIPADNVNQYQNNVYRRAKMLITEFINAHMDSIQYDKNSINIIETNNTPFSFKESYEILRKVLPALEQRTVEMIKQDPDSMDLQYRLHAVKSLRKVDIHGHHNVLDNLMAQMYPNLNKNFFKHFDNVQEDNSITSDNLDEKENHVFDKDSQTIDQEKRQSVAMRRRLSGIRYLKPSGAVSYIKQSEVTMMLLKTAGKTDGSIEKIRDYLKSAKSSAKRQGIASFLDYVLSKKSWYNDNSKEQRFISDEIFVRGSYKTLAEAQSVIRIVKKNNEGSAAFFQRIADEIQMPFEEVKSLFRGYRFDNFNTELTSYLNSLYYKDIINTVTRKKDGNTVYRTEYKREQGGKRMYFNTIGDIMVNIFNLYYKENPDTDVIAAVNSFTDKAKDYQDKKEAVYNLLRSVGYNTSNIQESMARMYEPLSIIISSVRSHVDAKIKGEKEYDIAEYVMDETGSLSDIAEVLWDNDETKTQSSYISKHDNNVKWLYSLASYGINRFTSLMGKEKKGMVLDRLTDLKTREPYYKNNIFINGINNIYRYSYNDGSYRHPINWGAQTPNDEAPLERNTREFLAQFLDYASRNNDKYLQEVYAIGEKRKTIGFEIKVLSEQSVRRAVESMIEQEISRVDPNAVGNEFYRTPNYIKNWQKSELPGISRYEDGYIITEQGNKINKAAAVNHVMTTMAEEYSEWFEQWFKIEALKDDGGIHWDMPSIDQIRRFHEKVVGYKTEKEKGSDEKEVDYYKRILGAAGWSWWMNNTVNGAALSQIAMGDPAFYSNPNDRLKRSTITYTDSYYAPLRDDLPKYTNIGIGQDLRSMISQQMAANLNEALVGDDYVETDAWVAALPEHMEMERIRYGNGYHIGNITKPIFSGNRVHIVDGKEVASMPLGGKCAVFVLSDELIDSVDVTDGNKLRRLRDDMRRNNVGYFGPPSAFKFGAPLREDQVSFDNETYRPIEKKSIITINADAFRIIYNPIKDLETKNPLNVQMSQAFNEVGDQESTAAAKKAWQLLAERQRISRAYIEKRYGSPALLKEAITDHVDDPIYKEMLEWSSEEYPGGLSLDNPLFEKKVVRNITSLMDKATTGFKIRGGNYILMPQYGFKKLRWKDEEGCTEVIVPAGSGLKIGDVIVGYRMPTTGLHMVLKLKVAGLHNESTNSIIAPGLLVYMHGIDFDIDSMYIYRKDPVDGKYKNRFLNNESQDKPLHERLGEMVESDPADENLYKEWSKAQNNAIIDAVIELLDKNKFKQLNAPISVKRIKGTERNGKFVEGVQEKSIRERLGKYNETRKITNAEYHAELASNVNLSRGAIGSTVSFKRGIDYIMGWFEKGSEPMLTEKYHLKLTINGTVVNYNRLSRREKTVVDGKVVERDVWINTVNGEKIYIPAITTETVDTIINIIIDNAKDGLATMMHLTQNNAPVFIMGLYFGIDLDAMTNLWQHRVVRELSKYRRFNIDNLNKVRNKMFNLYDEKDPEKRKARVKELQELGTDVELMNIPDGDEAMAKVLNIIESMILSQEKFENLSKVANIHKQIPSEHKDIMKVISNAKEIYNGDVTDINSFDKVPLMADSPVDFNIFDNPWIKECWSNMLSTKNMIESTLKAYHPDIIKMANEADKAIQKDLLQFRDAFQTGNFAAEHRDNMRVELVKYILSALQFKYKGILVDLDTSNEDVFEFSGQEHYGIDAFNERVAHRHRQLRNEYSDTNAFVHNVTTDRSYGYTILKAPTAHSMDQETINDLRIGFNMLEEEDQVMYLKYAVLNQALGMGGTNISTGVPIEAWASFDVAVRETLDKVVSTKGFMDNIMQDFTLSVLLNNIENLDQNKYFIDRIEKEDNFTVSGSEVVEDKKIFFDFKIPTDSLKDVKKGDVSEKEDTPKFIKNFGRLYVKSYESKDYVYYQEFAKIKRNPGYNLTKNVLSNGFNLWDVVNRYHKLFVTKALKDVITVNSAEKFDGEIKIGEEVIVRHQSDLNRRHLVTYVVDDIKEAKTKKGKDTRELTLKRVQTIEPEQHSKVEDDNVQPTPESTIAPILEKIYKRFGIKTEWVYDPAARWKGKFSKGRILLNSAKVTMDTPFHEIAHPFVDMIYKNNPALWNRLVEELTEEDMSVVKELYPDLDAVSQAKEAVTRKIGLYASEAYTKDRSSLTEALKRFFEYVTDIFKKMLNIDVTASPDVTLKTIGEWLALGEGKVNLLGQVDKNIDYVFNQNPKLGEIGTKQAYQEYLQTIFPNSLVKDIVYHGTNNEFNRFNEKFIGTATHYPGMKYGLPKGFYFTKDRDIAEKEWSNNGKVITAILNMKNPQIMSNRIFHNILDGPSALFLTQKEYDNLPNNTKQYFGKDVLIRDLQSDSIIIEKDISIKYDKRFQDTQEVVYNSNQIHILGSSKDIEGFKEYIEKNTWESREEGEKFSLLNKMKEKSSRIQRKRQGEEAIYLFEGEQGKSCTDNIRTKFTFQKSFEDRVKTIVIRDFRDRGIYIADKEGNIIKKEESLFVNNVRYDVQQYTQKVALDLLLNMQKGTVKHTFPEEIFSEDKQEVRSRREWLAEGGDDSRLKGQSVNTKHLEWIKEQWNIVMNKLDLGVPYTDFDNKQKMMGRENRALPEVQGFDKDFKIGYTMDLVVQKPSGILSIFDWKFGTSFHNEHAYSIMKYGEGAEDTYNNPLELAKLQLAWYAFLTKKNHPEARFDRLEVIVWNQYDPVKIHGADLANKLKMIEKYVKAEHADLYKQLQQEGLFEYKNYSSSLMSTQEEINKMEGKTPEDAEKVWEQKLLYYQLKASQQDLTTDEKREYDKAWRTLKDYQKLPSDDVLSNKSDIGQLKRYFGSLYDVKDPRVQAFTRVFMRRKTEIQQKMDQMENTMKDLYLDILRRRTGNAKLTLTMKQLSGINVMKEFGFMYERVGDSSSYSMVVPGEGKWDNLLPEEQKFIQYIYDNMHNTYRQVMGKAVPLQDKRYQRFIDFLPSGYRTIVLDKGFIPKHPMSESEFAQQYSARQLDPRYLKHAFNKMMTSYYDDFNYGNDPVAGIIPIKYMGNQAIADSKNHTLNPFIYHTEFMRNLYTKDQMEGVMAFGNAVIREMELHKDSNGNVHLANTANMLKDQIKMQILNEKHEFKPFGKQMKVPKWDGQKFDGTTTIELSKVAIGMKNFVTFGTMALRPFMAGYNTIMFMMFNHKKAIVGSLTKRLRVPVNQIDFSMKDLLFAEGQWMLYVKDWVTGNLDNNKVYTLAKKFRYLTENYDFRIRSNTALVGSSKLLQQSHMYAMFRAGEDFGSLTLMVAQLKHMKTVDKDGKEISMWDAYTDEGEYIGGVRGKVQVADDTYRDLRGLDENEIMILKRVSQKINGSYRPEERAAAEAYVWGQWALQFKKYFPTYMMNLFGSKFMDPTQGRYQKTGDKWTDENGNEMDVYALMKRENEGVILELTKSFLAYTLIKNGSMDDYKFRNLTPIQRQRYIDLMVTGALIGLWLVSRGTMFDDDDKEKNWYVRLDRLFTQDVTQGLAPLDIMYSLKDQTVILPRLYKLVDATWDFVFNGMINGDRQDNGRFPGELEIKKTLPPFTIMYEWNKYVNESRKEDEQFLWFLEPSTVLR